ncbi:MAG: DNA polymerase III subunit delta' [Hyphomicrobiaceae bacterium]
MTKRPREATPAPEEALPEADRLEGFPHPRETLDLVGQARAEQVLLEAYRSGHLHHAWLLTGPEGVGKATLAYRFTRFLLAGGPEDALLPQHDLAVPPSLPAVRQVAALSHPGLLVIRRPYDLKKKRIPASIPVDEVRRLKEFLALTADDGAWRVVIVDRADEMNASAANALLKSLEEPPARTVFLLVTAEPGRLLTTIRSRTRRLDLSSLAEDDLARVLTGLLAGAGEAPPTPEEAELLATLSGGSVRRALVLRSGDGLALYERLIKVLGASKPGPDILKLADRVDDFAVIVDLVQGLMNRLARQAALGAGALPAERRLAARLAAPDALASWAQLWETVGRARSDALTLNLDRRALLVDLLTRLTELGRDAA